MAQTHCPTPTGAQTSVPVPAKTLHNRERPLRRENISPTTAFICGGMGQHLPYTHPPTHDIFPWRQLAHRHLTPGFRVVVVIVIVKRNPSPPSRQPSPATLYGALRPSVTLCHGRTSKHVLMKRRAALPPPTRSLPCLIGHNPRPDEILPGS